MTQSEINTAIDQLLSGVPTPSSDRGAHQWIVDAVEVFLAMRELHPSMREFPSGLPDK